MERTAYTLLEKMESSWWYHGRIRAVFAATAHAALPLVDAALDYGAGYGGMRKTCGRLAKAVDAFEPDADARHVVSTRGYREVFADEREAFVRRYDLIALFDVLEHLEHDRDFVRRAHESLTPSGYLIITVPAFMSLWSVHDVEHHHYRRYTRKALCALLTENGYRVEYVSYWNCLLSIPAAIMRLTGRSGEGGLTPSSFINACLKAFITMEEAILRYVPLPFGLSIVVIAQKV